MSFSQDGRAFVSRLKNHFQKFSELILSEIRSDEELTLNLEAESSLFVRFNANRVRQNTSVEQIRVPLSFHGNGRTVNYSTAIGGADLDVDVKKLREILALCRAETEVLPIDPHQVNMSNNGVSSDEFHGELLGTDELLDLVAETAAGLDLVGLYSGGPVVRANRNSHGQSHWFSTETFVFDYSLYDGPRASKAVYAGSKWETANWKANLSRAKRQLDLLARPLRSIAPGKYRTFMAPGAVSELSSMLSWGALSAAAWKQGQSPFKKFADHEVKLSPHLHVRENFRLGLTPRFNMLGEVAPETISLIEGGELRQLLVSSRTAKEFGLTSNAATEWEGPRSLEISPGRLDENSVLQELNTGLLLSNLHYLNWSDRMAARITGMTRYACFWVENGEIVAPIKDLRFDESMYEALGSKLAGLTSKSEIDPHVETYGGRRLGGRSIPGFLIEDFTFRA